MPEGRGKDGEEKRGRGTVLSLSSHSVSSLPTFELHPLLFGWCLGERFDVRGDLLPLFRGDPWFKFLDRLRDPDL